MNCSKRRIMPCKTDTKALFVADAEIEFTPLFIRQNWGEWRVTRLRKLATKRAAR